MRLITRVYGTPQDGDLVSSIYRWCSAAPIDWVAVTQFKTTNLILRAFSDFSRKLAPRKLPAIRYR